MKPDSVRGSRSDLSHNASSLLRSTGLVPLVLDWFGVLFFVPLQLLAGPPWLLFCNVFKHVSQP